MDAINGLKLHYKSKSGSSYYFTDKGVFRLSNHWGRAANCRWRLHGDNNNANRLKLGFARWADFYPDNDFEKLYFMEADFDKQAVQFFHKGSPNYKGGKLLRTAPETTKRIRQVRELFTQTAWAKYLKEENIDWLRREIIQKLIDTEGTFQEIRKAYL